MVLCRALVLVLASFFFSACIAFTNPIKSVDGSDPFMVYHDGYYYLTTTTWTNIQISRGKTIQELKNATPKIVWTDADASRCCNVWAPEIHWKAAESAWYIYYVAGTSDTLDNQRIHALKGTSTDIWASTWHYASRIIIPNRDTWAIDPTVLVTSTGEYLVYSSWNGNYQCLWISKFITATTVGNTVKISSPTLPWEQDGRNVEEGPASLYHNNRTWISFSASSCTTSGYSLGLLELTGSDPLSPSSWKKTTKSVFSSANGLLGTGHNGFFTSASGDETWVVFHYSTGTVYCDGSRKTAIQPISFDSNNEPVFGQPDALSLQIVDPV